MKKNNLFFELPICKVAGMAGMSVSTVWRHANGKRKISAEFAIRYHTALGIPLWRLRPDLWPEDQVREKMPTTES